MKQFFVQISDTLDRHRRASALHLLWLDFLLSVLGGATLIVLLGGYLAGSSGVAASLALFGIGCVIAGLGLRRGYPHDAFGLCNVITMARLALAASLASLLVLPVPPTDAALWLAFGVAVLALILDGVDGWAARRTGLSSGFGARFDMEVDSILALILALIAFKGGQAGLWVLALGVPRYLFVAAGAFWPRLRNDLPERLSRKIVCVFQIGTLVIVLIPILPAALVTLLVAAAAVALVWSFLRDIRYLLVADT